MGANLDGADLGPPGTWVTWIQPTAQHFSPPETFSNLLMLRVGSEGWPVVPSQPKGAPL